MQKRKVFPLRLSQENWRRLSIACAGALGAGAIGAGILFGWPAWTGIGGGRSESVTTERDVDGNITSIVETTTLEQGKTAWDLLELLIAPALLVIMGASISEYLKTRDDKQREQEKRIEDRRLQQEREIADDRSCQDVLKDYLDQMTVVFVNEAWPKMQIGTMSRKDQKMIAAVVRARTLVVLEELDVRRQGILLRFLGESGAIKDISLENVNLSKAKIGDAHLSGTNLRNANLIGADLQGVYLNDTDLCEADLSAASLVHAHLNGASLRCSSLIGADLRGAYLDKANLIDAEFREAKLSAVSLCEADLGGANLDSADLSFAKLNRADLTEANLMSANLRYADFTDALLIGTNLSGAQNLTLEQLTGENRPFLCGVNLPSYITDIDPNRDCDCLLKALVDEFSRSSWGATEIVEFARNKMWNKA